MTEKKTQKLICIITGRSLFATRDYFNKKVEKLGSEKQVLSTYICKEAKDLLRKGYNVNKIREMLNVDESNLTDVPEQTINDVLNSKKTYYRRINNFNTTQILNSRTDPDVKKLVQNILNEERK